MNPDARFLMKVRILAMIFTSSWDLWKASAIGIQDKMVCIDSEEIRKK